MQKSVVSPRKWMNSRQSVFILCYLGLKAVATPAEVSVFVMFVEQWSIKHILEPN